MYLDDGHISKMRHHSHRLRIYLNRKHHDVIARVKEAVSSLLPDHRVGEVQQRVAQVTAYSFSNRSDDILCLVMWACGLLRSGCRRNSRWRLSIARRRDVAKLDRLVGWKRQLAFPFTAASAFHPR
jgi:hypothetical protein